MNKVFVFLSVLVILASSCKEKGKEDFSYVGWTTDEVVNGDFEKLKKLSNDQLNVSESSFLALGYADYSFWIKLEVNPKFRTAENTSLEISNPMLNEIQIYSSNGVLLKELGRVNFKWNDPKSFFNRFEIPPSDDFTYFIKVNSYGNNNIPIYLIKGNEDGWTIDERNLFFGIYFGIIS